MSVEPTKVHETVNRAVNHNWSVPEFQRGFVWKTTQVRDLAESLWLDFPIGSLLLWSSSGPQEARAARDGNVPSLWIVDGQQRTTALAILFGYKPYWWPAVDDWNKTMTRYDIRFDVEATEQPFFLIANAAIRKAHGDRYVPLRTLLPLDPKDEGDQEKLEALAARIKEQDLCHGLNALGVYAKLERVRQIRDRDIITVTVSHELEDVVEIFSRLNSRGTRVTEADIYLGIVASRNPGWVRDDFLPYLRSLEAEGFHLDPNLLFRSLTAIGAGSVRFKDISDEFWGSDQLMRAWERCRKAWGAAIGRFHQVGILSDDPLPTKSALVTLIALLERFPDTKFDPLFYWFLQASRFGRYSGSAFTALDEDLRDIKAAPDSSAAVLALLKRIPVAPVQGDDFLRDYGDSRFGRLMLYLIAYQRQAQDWDKAGQRLGFESGEILKDFRPQWHHIFPSKFLAGKAEPAQIDALSNIAVIGPGINVRISDKDPMDYLDKYEISDQKLNQQLIDPERARFTVAGFPEFLDRRASRLAEAANEYLSALAGELPILESAELAPAAI